jgi:type II secretory pathway component PulK
MCAGQETKMRSQGKRNDRGVALLIVLLVTALLIALIFEFSYATRVSLNSAINFRDSQRAYFLARSGIFAFIKYGDNLRDNYIPQGELRDVPGLSEADTRVMLLWEDEAGKIWIKDVKTNSYTQGIVKSLFENKGIDVKVYNSMVDSTSTIHNLSLLSELHQYMSDEEFIKVYNCLTASPVTQPGASKYININTASSDVLQTLGLSAGDIQDINEKRSQTPLRAGTMPDSVRNTMVPGLTSTAAGNFLTDQSHIYKVVVYATVGGYTKQIEAIVDVSNPSRPTFYYWKSL